MERSGLDRPMHLSLRPLHTWSPRLKRLVWFVACLLCSLAYLLLFASGLSLIATLLTLEW